MGMPGLYCREPVAVDLPGSPLGEVFTHDEGDSPDKGDVSQAMAFLLAFLDSPARLLENQTTVIDCRSPRRLSAAVLPQTRTQTPALAGYEDAVACR